MINDIKRVRYFKGEFLQAEDFTLEQDYHRRMRYLHNEALYTEGILYGLEVTKKGGTQISVAKGMALVNADFSEAISTQVLREAVVEEEQLINLPGNAEGDLYVTLELNESRNEGPNDFERRWHEDCVIKTLKDDDVGNRLVLAKIAINGASNDEIISVGDGDGSLTRRMAAMRVSGGLLLPNNKPANFVKAFCMAKKSEGTLELKRNLCVKSFTENGSGNFTFTFDIREWDEVTKQFPVISIAVGHPGAPLFYQVKTWIHDSEIGEANLKIKVSALSGQTIMTPLWLYITIH